MTQTDIPYLFMRGGTSRGPYLNRHDLPEDLDTLAKVLIAIVGAGHPLNIDGIGGGNAVTTKVAMLSPSDAAGCDVDYFFGQVSVEDHQVDFKPTCGNMLVAVGPAAIEMGLVPVTGDETTVRIRLVNTEARVTARIQTPNGAVNYDGTTAIDGVPGTAAPVQVMFHDTVGGATGAMFPTGNRIDRFDGVDVSCMDVAMPMVMARAEAFGLTGYETTAELDDNRAFFDRMEAIRIQAGAAMGMGDVTQSVTPKFAVLAAPRNGGTATARYFMPWRTHPTLALTGGQCICACLLSPGTVAEGLAHGVTKAPLRMAIEHPVGQLEIEVDYTIDGQDVQMHAAGLERTARKLASGHVHIPRAIWGGK